MSYIKKFITKPRIGRIEYVVGSTAVFAATMALVTAGVVAFNDNNAAVVAVATVPFLTGAAAQVRLAVQRLHDTGISGWWVLAIILASAIPYVGWLAWLPLIFMAGDEGANEFGQSN